MNKFALFGLGVVTGFVVAIAVQTVVVKLKDKDTEEASAEKEEPVEGKVVNAEARFRCQKNDDQSSGDACECSKEEHSEDVRQSSEDHEYGDPEYFEHPDSVLCETHAWQHGYGLTGTEDYETHINFELADGQFAIPYNVYLRERVLQKSPYTEILVKWKAHDKLMYMDQDGTVLEPEEQFPGFDMPKIMKIQDEMPLIVVDTQFCYMWVIQNEE